MRYFLAILILLWAAPAWGADQIIRDGASYRECSGAEDCADACNGSGNWIIGDMEAALNTAGANSTLYICNGTYTGTEIDADSQLDVTHDGQTISGVGGAENVILDANGAGTNVVYIDNKNNVVVERITAIGSTGDGIRAKDGSGSFEPVTVRDCIVRDVTGNGILYYVYTAANEISSSSVIQNNKVYDCQKSGIVIQGFADTPIISGNEVYNCGLGSARHGIVVATLYVSVTSGWTDQSQNIYSIASQNSRTIYRVANVTTDEDLTEATSVPTTPGVGEWGQDSGILYVYCATDLTSSPGVVRYSQTMTTVDITMNVVHDMVATPDHGHGIAYDDFGTGSITKNKSYDNDGAGILVHFTHGGEISNNLVYGNGATNGDGGIYLEQAIKNTNVYHNTTRNNTGDGIVMVSPLHSVNIRNNLVEGNSAYGIDAEASGTSDITCSHNATYNNTSGATDNVTNSNSVTTNPNTSADGWAASPALWNTATDVSFTDDYYGIKRDATPSIGAVEMGHMRLELRRP